LQELEDARAINAQQRHGFAEAQAKHAELHADLQQKEASLATCQVRLTRQQHQHCCLAGGSRLQHDMKAAAL
jgi:hypothetical protein